MPSAAILVLAGTNGAGKSSLGGAALQKAGAAWYDPDRAARRYLAAGLSQADANSRAWHRGRVQLEQAVRQGTDYAFETTLGGRTITRLLLQAAAAGHRLRIWYVGLSSPELHIRRVRERAERGGHDIPEPLIRARWTSSRENLIRLLPHLAELALYDNSADARLHDGDPPRPLRILHAREARILHLAPPAQVPAWPRPIIAAALHAWRAA